MRRQNRYDENDLRAIQYSSIRLDANQSMFFARELEYVKSQTYDIAYPELSAFNVIPVSTEAGDGVDVIVYGVYDSVGVAKIVTNYAADLPRADVVGKEYTAKVKNVADSFGYNIDEIAAASRTGKPLQARKATSARRAAEQEVNRIAWHGDSANGMLGLLSHPNVGVYALSTTGTGTPNTAWKGKTGAQVLDDLNGMQEKIVTDTRDVEKPDTLLLPPGQYARLASTPMNDKTETSILEYFLKASPYIKQAKPVAELIGSTPGVNDVAIMYKASKEKLTLEVPVPFQILPPQARNLEFVSPCRMKTAGVIIYYPLSICKAIGV